MILLHLVMDHLLSLLFPLLVCLHFLIPAHCQNGFNNPDDQNAVINTFYLTSKSDCGDDLKNVFGNIAYVKGYDLGNFGGTGPTSCTIKITSMSVYPGVQLELLIIAMNIQECRTQLTIYDGQGSSTLFDSYDCRTSKNYYRQPRVTSGDTVTFILSRGNPDNHAFDIEIRVRPLTSGGGDPDRPGNFNPFDFEKFDQDAIVGMISGFYALVAIVCIALVFYFYCKFNGMNKKWETHQLQTIKTTTSFDARTQASQPPWSVATASQRGPTSQYARSFTETYSRKGATARSEDGSSDIYDHDEKFQQRNLMTQRDRRNGRDRMASQNSVCSDNEPEEARDNFKEKVITPRGRWKPKNQRPPSFEEATRESSGEESSEQDEESEESSDDNSIRKRLTTSSEDNDYTESETESESGQSTGSSNTGARAKKKAKSKKAKEKSKSRRRRQSSSDDASSRRTEPRARQQAPPHQPQAGLPYNPYPPMGGQFVPVMAGPPPQFQPVQMVPPNYPPPQYPVESSQGQVKPTDPPVYSYLVRRGYTPMDPNTRGGSPAGSAVSSHRGGPPSRDEPDTQLQSGVEYMRR